MEIFIFWLLLSVLVGVLGGKRKIGFGWAFFWAIILSPLIGLIIALLSAPVVEPITSREAAYHQQQAVKLYTAGQIPDAIDQLNKAINLAPANNEYHLQLAKLHFITNNTELMSIHLSKAKSLNQAAFARAIKIMPQYLELKNSEAFQNWEQAQ